MSGSAASPASKQRPAVPALRERAQQPDAKSGRSKRVRSRPFALGRGAGLGPSSGDCADDAAAHPGDRPPARKKRPLGTAVVNDVRSGHRQGAPHQNRRDRSDSVLCSHMLEAKRTLYAASERSAGPLITSAIRAAKSDGVPPCQRTETRSERCIYIQCDRRRISS